MVVVAKKRGRVPIPVTIGGRTQALADWAAEYHIGINTMQSRWWRGVRGERLLESKLERRRGSKYKITINGETHTLNEWAKMTHIPYITLNHRYHAGLRGPFLLEPPPKPRVAVESAYSEDELFILYKFFAGQPDELVMLRDFMGGDRPGAKRLLDKFRKRYAETQREESA